MHLVQLIHPQHGRGIALVETSTLRLLAQHATLYDLAQAAIERNITIEKLVTESTPSGTLDYGEIYDGKSPWRLLPSFDHPYESARCLVSGTGLTHKASAENRARMHQQQPETITDSMRMYQWGLEGGSPAPGEAGVQPEWFYKGTGAILRAHGEPLAIPPFAEDGGEEPEIAGVYVIGADGSPYRVGLTSGNEFSDHKMERRNYLYLAPSKLRECAIGPELVTGHPFASVTGQVRIERAGATVWSADIFTGEANMSHSLANLEYHHFKYPEHRRPGDVHVHFFGADAFSFGAGLSLEANDTMEVVWEGMGRPLRNRLRAETAPLAFVSVIPL